MSTMHACQGDTLLITATDISQNNGNLNMWDKGQMRVIFSCKKRARDTIFVGDKNNTLTAFSTLLTRKTQWTDYMKEIISIITINLTTNYDLNTTESTISMIMTQLTFHFLVRDVSLPQCNIGYVYIFISIKYVTFTYIGKSKSIRRRIQQNNYGVVLVATETLHLQPYALIDYICGFE